MTSKPHRIRRAITATGIGLTMFGGGFLLSGIPAAHAAPSPEPALFTCTNDVTGSTVTVPAPFKHILELAGYTCTKATLG